MLFASIARCSSLNRHPRSSPMSHVQEGNEGTWRTKVTTVKRPEHIPAGCSTTSFLWFRCGGYGRNDATTWTRMAIPRNCAGFLAFCSIYTHSLALLVVEIGSKVAFPPSDCSTVNAKRCLHVQEVQSDVKYILNGSILAILIFFVAEDYQISRFFMQLYSREGPTRCCHRSTTTTSTSNNCTYPSAHKK